MKNQTLRSAVLVVTLCIVAAGMASANTIHTTMLMGSISSGPKAVVTTYVPFPAAGDTFCTTAYGCGTLPSGGSTDPMWTTGDYVSSAAFTLQNGPIVALTADWSFENFLGGGSSEMWYVFINNTPVAAFLAPDNSYNGDIFTVSGTVSFAPYTVPLANSYTVSLVLGNTVPYGGGSVDFLEGGVTGLTTVPEPGSLMLLGSGVVGLAGLLRRKLF